MGRPSTFTPELALRICERMARGESLRSICRDDGMPVISTVMLWLTKDAVFSEQYARARDDRADHWAEEIIEIADDAALDTIEGEDGNVRQNAEFVNRSRLRVDTRKWLMARMAPKKYGDRITQDTTVRGGLEIVIRDIAAEKAKSKP